MGPIANISPIVMSRIGAVASTLARNRRCISVSSGFVSGSRLTVRGSSAIPQIGQDPGPVRTTSGCIGQVYVVGAAETAGAGRGGGASPVYFDGSARNFSRQRGLQKY